MGDAASYLYRCLTIAEHLIPVPDQDSPAIVDGGQVMVHSSPAWNPGAAFAATDIFYGVRNLEAEVRLAVTGSGADPRGSSDGNTRAAMIAIVNLAEAVDRHGYRDPKDKTPCQCGHCRIMRSLWAWARSVEVLAAVDEAARWSVIRHADAKRIMCPYCDTPSLRAAVPWGMVACGNPACKDTAGNSPVAYMHESALKHGHGFLLWQDGRIT